MKNPYIMTLLATLSMSGMALAQAPITPVLLPTYIQVSSAPGVMKTLLVAGNEKGVQIKPNIQTTDVQTIPFDNVKYIYVIPVSDYLEAKGAYYAGNYADARTKLAAIKTKYATVADIPNGFVAEAAYYELDSAIRLLDWKGAADLNTKVKPQILPATFKEDYNVICLLLKAQDPQKAAEVKTEAETLLQKMSKLSAFNIGRINYALACAKVNLKAPITEILDAYAFTISASHGADKTLAADACTKSIDIMLETEEVKKVLSGSIAKPTKKVWNSWPSIMREACSLVAYYKDMYAPNGVLPATYNNLYTMYFALPVTAPKPAKPEPEPGKVDPKPAPAAKK